MLHVRAVTIKAARQRIGCKTRVLQAVSLILSYIIGEEFTEVTREPLRVAPPHLPSSSNTNREVVKFCAEDKPVEARQKITASFMIYRVENYLDHEMAQWRAG